MKHTFPYILAACLLLCTGCTAKNTDSATEPSRTESASARTETIEETDISTNTNTVSDLPAESVTTESAQTEMITETDVTGETIDLKSPPEAMTEMDALAAICMAEGWTEELALDTASYMREKARELSGTLFGEITSEEDAIAKGRDVLMLIGAGDSVERAESEYVEIGGELVKYERDGEPWHVEHFPEYDAWRVTPALPSGVTEDGRFVAAPGQPPYVIMRGADGAVLGVFH